MKHSSLRRFDILRQICHRKTRFTNYQQRGALFHAVVLIQPRKHFYAKCFLAKVIFFSRQDFVPITKMRYACLDQIGIQSKFHPLITVYGFLRLP